MRIPIRSLKRKLTRKKLEEHHSRGVDIGARVHQTPADLLGRHVINATDDLSSSCKGFASSGARDPEVHDLGNALFQNKNIGRLYVAMNNVALMRILEPFAHLTDKSNLVD